MILVDTSVWSLAYRRRKRAPAHPAAVHLRSLVETGEPLAVPGIVLQELLSGLRDPSEERRLDAILSPFPLVLANRTDHIRAARVRSDCAAKGVAASSVDCLIAATAIERDADLFAVDSDFATLSRCCPLRLLHI